MIRGWNGALFITLLQLCVAISLHLHQPQCIRSAHDLCVRTKGLTLSIQEGCVLRCLSPRVRRGSAKPVLAPLSHHLIFTLILTLVTCPINPLDYKSPPSCHLILPSLPIRALSRAPAVGTVPLRPNLPRARHHHVRRRLRNHRQTPLLTVMQIRRRLPITARLVAPVAPHQDRVYHPSGGNFQLHRTHLPSPRISARLTSKD